jgi:hypothetical protein
MPSSAIGITAASATGANQLMPGVSALLSTPSAAGTSGPELEAGDVPVAAIVRSSAQ